MSKQKLIRFDWAMKRLLRNKANFDILEGFLTELLGEEIKIISTWESESNQKYRTDKYNRVDILVEDSKGELIIIEVQNDTEHDFLQRLYFGTATLSLETIDEGMAYGEIRKVISIAIVFFDLGQGEDYIYKGQTRFVGINKGDTLKLNSTQTELYKKELVEQIFPEYYLIKVNKFNDVAKSTLDEWIYFLKNEEIKDEFRAKGIQKAKKAFSIMKLSEKDRDEYNQYLNDLRYQKSMFDSSYKAGRIERDVEIIKQCYEQNISPEQTSLLLEIPIERVIELYKQFE